MVPEGTCVPLRANWFRNLAGNQAFGRFSQTSTACVTTPQPPAPVAADYSLQLASTVSRSLANNTFNPCTWDTDNPPTTATAGPAAPTGEAPAPAVAGGDERSITPTTEAGAPPAAETSTESGVPVYEVKRE
jgi:hypothetical protein